MAKRSGSHREVKNIKKMHARERNAINLAVIALEVIIIYQYIAALSDMK